MDNAFAPQDVSLTTSDNAFLASTDVLLATPQPLALLVLLLFFFKEILVFQDADQAIIRTDSFALLALQAAPAAQDLTSASFACQDNSPTTDSATTTALQDQSATMTQPVLLAMSLALPALNIQANVLPAHLAAEISSTSDV